MWEHVHTEKSAGESSVTDRLQVPGGWIVRQTENRGFGEEVSPVAVALVFVPDPHNQWALA